MAMALVILVVPAWAAAQDAAAVREPDRLAAAAAEVAVPSVPEAAGPVLPRPIADAVESEVLVRTAHRRPAGLGVLYGSLAALNALDTYSTVRALDRGAVEANPLMAPAAGSPGVSLAIKAATTASAICFSERLWKKNRAAAVLTMVAVNAGTALVVARNVRNERAR